MPFAALEGRLLALFAAPRRLLSPPTRVGCSRADGQGSEPGGRESWGQAAAPSPNQDLQLEPASPLPEHRACRRAVPVGLCRVVPPARGRCSAGASLGSAPRRKNSSRVTFNRRKLPRARNVLQSQSMCVVTPQNTFLVLAAFSSLALCRSEGSEPPWPSSGEGCSWCRCRSKARPAS